MIGDKIVEMRKKQGLTLTKLAKRANISKSYLSNIERNVNKNPSIQVLEKISEALDINVQYFTNTVNSENQSVQIVLDQEWADFVIKAQKSGVTKKQLEEYKILIDYINWKSKNKDGLRFPDSDSR